MPYKQYKRRLSDADENRINKRPHSSGDVSTNHGLEGSLDASTHTINQGNTTTIAGSSNHIEIHTGAKIYVDQGTELASPELTRIISSVLRSHNAEYNMSKNVARGPCAPQTRTSLLETLTTWATSSQVRLYWLTGIAGTGKTTVAFSFSDQMVQQKCLGATFFCSRSLQDCRDITLIIPTLAYQLAMRYHPFKQALARILESDCDIGNRDLNAQFRSLLLDPWKSESNKLPSDMLIVLDALDECDSDPSSFIRVLFDNITELPFKILITSRPEYSIRGALKNKDPCVLTTFILHEVEKDLVEADIAIYLDHQLSHRVPADILDALKELSGALFIVAATLAKFFIGANVSPRRRLELLNASLKEQQTALAPLDAFYQGVLSSALQEGELFDEEIEEIKDLLFTIVCARDPLTREGLAGILDLPKDEVDRLLCSLYSVVFIPNDHSHPIFVFHVSFTDFIQSAQRSGRYCCHPKRFHIRLTERCLRLLNNQLHQNLCALDRSTPNNIVDPETLELHVSHSLRYAAIYWAEHWMLSETSSRMDLKSAISDLIVKHALHWIECLSLLSKLPVAVQTLEDIQNEFDEDVALTTLIHDSCRVIKYVYDVIESSAMQTYYSALTWIPTNSPLHGYHTNLRQKAPYVLCGLSAQWTGPERTINTHPGHVNLILRGIHSLSISQDGSRLASGSYDNTIRIWNLRNQAEESILTGHTGIVRSVVITQNGDRVISGSDDETIRVWDMATKHPLLTLSATKQISTVDISANGKWIASGHSDGFVRIWDAVTGQLLHQRCRNRLRSHRQAVSLPDTGSDPIPWVTFSPGGTFVAPGSPNLHLITPSYEPSPSGPRPFSTPKKTQTRKGPEPDTIHSVTFSPNSVFLVSGGSTDADVWDVRTQSLSFTLSGHISNVLCVACSPAGDRIITCSTDQTARLWNMSGDELRVLQGHSDSVNAVAFIPDGRRAVTGSDDGTLRVWDLLSGHTVHVFAGAGHVESLAVFPNGFKVASCSGNSIAIWSLSTVNQTTLIEGEARRDAPIPFLEAQTIAFSTNGRRVLVTPKLRILDTATLEEKALLLPRQDVEYGRGVFSPSGNRIAACVRGTPVVEVWELRGDGIAGDSVTLTGHSDKVKLLCFSHDDQQLASVSEDPPVRVWSMQTGQVVHVLEHLFYVLCAAFSHDSTRIITSGARITCIWDAHSGNKLRQLAENAFSVVFTPDDHHLIASFGATITTFSAKTLRRKHKYHNFDFWTTLEDGSSYALSKDGWVCRIAYLGDEPHKLLWVPSQYRPSIGKGDISGPLFTSCSRGIQVCLPRKDGLITLVIPFDDLD